MLARIVDRGSWKLAFLENSTRQPFSRFEILRLRQFLIFRYLSEDPIINDKSEISPAELSEDVLKRVQLLLLLLILVPGIVNFATPVYNFEAWRLAVLLLVPDRCAGIIDCSLSRVYLG
jgi:hypothetical protein